MPPPKEPFHLRLQRLRMLRKLTAKSLARALEIPESTYREWEYGKGRLLPLEKISQVLAISVTELVTGTPPEMQSHLEELEKIEQMLRQLRLKIGSLN